MRERVNAGLAVPEGVSKEAGSGVRTVMVAKAGHSYTGVGRYAETITTALRNTGVEVVPIAPAVPPIPGPACSAMRRLGIDLRAFFMNYPVWARYPEADVYHLSSQNLASLLVFRPPAGKVVVTVHDIIPFILRNDRRLSSYRTIADRLFDRIAMAGLGRADRIIAVSRYTGQCLVEHLGIHPDKIQVIHEGVDSGRFRLLDVPTFLRGRYGLPEGRPYLIYVGSEAPRKNLSTLVRALAELRRALPGLELIKVGRAHFDQERKRLIDLARDLGVLPAIHFLDEVPEDDLPLLYNLADVAVIPSLYEGFGLPALEAVACGTPAVCARAASLPELMGDAALFFEPTDVDGLVQAVTTLLTNSGLRLESRERGLAKAETFRWEYAALQVLRVYQGNA